jgi:hypothetical protein
MGRLGLHPAAVCECGLTNQMPQQTHSAGLPHHDTSTALLARADDSQDQASGHSGRTAENITHSAGLPHHDTSTALLARADDPQDQALGHSGRTAENVTV